MMSIIRELKAVFPAFLALCFLTSNCLAQSAPDAAVRLSTIDELRAEFESIACKNEDRLEAVRALFEKMGARPEEISVEGDKKVRNLVIRNLSQSNDGSGVGRNEKIVVGAHYDLKGNGCGAVDNWSGIISIAHIYRSLKDTPLNKNFVFVAFGKEEEGLVGSSMMVAGINKERAKEYCAMVNIDSLGLGIPHAADNFSSKKLVEASMVLAADLSTPFKHARLEGGDSDSSSFIKKRVPAITIHGLGNEWRKIIHSEKDMVDKIDFENVFNGYRLALALLLKIDQSPCQAFR